MLLRIEGITKYYGGVCVLSDVDMIINDGQIVGVIGPNGAGKSTMFNVITGFARPNKGKVVFEGKDITAKKPWLIAKMGIGRTFQLATAFDELTVLENVLASFHLHAAPNLWEAIFHGRGSRLKEHHILDQAVRILNTVGLIEVQDQLAKNLPHGHQKMLTMARALAINPKVLLLDEPLGGMNSAEVDATIQAIAKARESGITIVLVEHNLRIMDLCDKVIVLNYGCKIAEGPPEEVRENREVLSVYLGGEVVA